ncbi:MAG: DUF1559 domain-containing protein [Pirellulaceae bacterium]
MVRRRIGFTLVELLVVIAIIGILVGLLLPAVQAAREAARRMSCSNNLKQLGLSLHNYSDTFQTLPPDAIWHGNLRGTTAVAGDQRNYTWMCMILPFIEGSTLYDQINFPSLFSQHCQQSQLAVKPPRRWCFQRCCVLPTTSGRKDQRPWGFGITSYAVNAGWDGHRRFAGDLGRAGVFPFYDAVRLDDIKDGTSNTIAIGEVTTVGFACRNTNPARAKVVAVVTGEQMRL